MEINYDSGRKSDTYKPFGIGYMDVPILQSKPIPNLFNPNQSSIAIVERIRFIHEKFRLFINLHKEFTEDETTSLSSIEKNIFIAEQKHQKEFMDGTLTKGDYYRKTMEEYCSRQKCSTGTPPRNQLGFEEKPTLLYKYKLESEIIIHLMKKVLDTLFQLGNLLVDYDTVLQQKKLKFTEIGQLFRDSGSGNPLLDHMFLGGGEFEVDRTNFLEVINGLCNALKHSLVNEESYHVVSAESAPSFYAIHFPNNNFTKYYKVHNHNSYHIMMGFQDNIKRILKNMKRFQELD